jgi:hypothetical protein
MTVTYHDIPATPWRFALFTTHKGEPATAFKHTDGRLFIWNGPVADVDAPVICRAYDIGYSQGSESYDNPS